MRWRRRRGGGRRWSWLDDLHFLEEAGLGFDAVDLGDHEVAGIEVHEVVDDGEVDDVDGAADSGGLAAVGEEVVGVLDAECGDEEFGAFEVGFLEDGEVFGAAEEGFAGEFFEFGGIGVDGEDGFAELVEAGGEGDAEGVHADDDDVAGEVFVVGGGLGFVIGGGGAEEAGVEQADFFAECEEWLAVEDHVGGDGDGGDADECGDGEDVRTDEAAAEAHAGEDEGEFADLGDGDAGEE